MQCSLESFIDRWAQHIPGRSQHAVRSFGLFAPRALRQTSAAIFAILGQERILADDNWEKIATIKRPKMPETLPDIPSHEEMTILGSGAV